MPTRPGEARQKLRRAAVSSKSTSRACARDVSSSRKRLMSALSLIQVSPNTGNTWLKHGHESALRGDERAVLHMNTQFDVRMACGFPQERRLAEVADRYGESRREAILYYTILYYTILYYTILYYTILYYAPRRQAFSD